MHVVKTLDWEIPNYMLTISQFIRLIPITLFYMHYEVFKLYIM